MRKYYLAICLLLFHSNLFSTEINRKFGKVSKEELLMNVYEKDSSAEALVLFDIGRSYFQYNVEKGFVMIFERTVRIKIFNEDGFKYADFSIPLYNDLGNQNTERVSGLKANTYNLENNKIKVEKLSRKNIYNVIDSKNKTLRKFSLPSVREGSVIEVSYSIQSDFFYNLQEWEFQSFIPTMWSEYTVEIPEYFKYNNYGTGYLPFKINTTETKPDVISITSKERGNSQETRYVTKTTFNNQEIRFNKEVHKLAVENAPAMKEESYMLSYRNYISGVRFELSYTKFPGQKIKKYSESWESINKKLLNHPDFGGQIKNAYYLKDLIASAKNQYKDPVGQVNFYFHYITSNFKWNNSNSMFVSKNLKKAVNEKTGNSADLNLLMLLLLKESGFNVKPVILSTRNHGLLNPVYPSVSQMNYVITLLNLNEENILIDVTDPYCLPGKLPPRCFNDKGRIVSETGSKWINIDPTEKFSTIYLGNLNITEDGIKGDLSGVHRGFASYNFRNLYNSFESEEELISNLESKNPGIKVNNYTFENIDSINKPIKIKYSDFSLESFESMGDIIYLNPIVLDKVESNPFKLEKRDYPIDYNYLYNQKYIFNYSIPDGYSIEEMPKSEKYELPGGSAKFLYLVKNVGSNIQVTVQLNINKRQFMPGDYEYLKDFYNRIIAKEKEQIILKKS